MNAAAAWRALHAQNIDSEHLRVCLDTLASASITERTPVIGALEVALHHDHAPVRAAALRVLSGATGHLAISSMVAALDDSEPDVWRTAVRALARSAHHDPARFFHALFHPRAEVRAEALARAPRAISSSERLLLAFDDAIRPAILDSTLIQQPEAAPVLLALHAREHIDTPTLLRHLAHLPWETRPQACLDAIPSPARLPSCALPLGELMALLRGEQSNDATYVRQPDPLDDLLSQLLESPHGPTLTNALELNLQRDSLPWRCHLRVAFSLAATQHTWTPNVLAIAAWALPQLLTSASIPLTTRRDALARFHTYRSRSSVTRNLHHLLWTDLLTGDAWNLDLHLVTQLLPTTEGHQPLITLHERLGDTPILDAFTRNAHRALPFALRILHPDAADPRLHALLARCMARLGETRAASTIAALLNVAHTTERFSWTWMHTLRRIHPDAAQAALSHWIQHPIPAQTLSTADARAALFATLSQLPTDALLDLTCAALARDDIAEPTREHLLSLLWTAGISERLDALLERLDLDGLIRLTTRVEDNLHLLPRHKYAIADALKHHPHHAIASRAQSFAYTPTETPHTRTFKGLLCKLPAADAERIVGAPDADIPAALDAVYHQAIYGLTPLIEKRKPSTLDAALEIALALLLSHDPILDVSAQLHRFLPNTPRTHTQLITMLRARCVHLTRLPLPAAALLSDFGPRLDDAITAFDTHGLTSTLRPTPALHPILRHALFDAAERAAKRWRWTLAPDAFDAALERDALRDLQRTLATQHPTLAARIDTLQSLQSMRRERPRRPSDRVLLRAAQSPVHATAERAILRLLTTERTAELIPLATLTNPALDKLLESTLLWTDTDALHALTQRALDPTQPALLRWRILTTLHNIGSPGADIAIHAPDILPHIPAGAPLDLTQLPDLTLDLATQLARSPHDGLRHRAASALVSAAPAHDLGEDARDALRGLVCGDGALPRDMRDAIAHHLLGFAPEGAALTAARILRDPANIEPGDWSKLRAQDNRPLMTALPRAILDVGAAHLPEKLALTAHEQLHGEPWLSHAKRMQILMELLDASRDHDLQKHIITRLQTPTYNAIGTRRLAETLAWGISKGLELTSQRFRVRLIGGSELGYTRLTQPVVYVNPLPMLHGERHGQAIVEGLILHELGHHMYHASEEAMATTKQAHDEGLGALLNLVADEHLERNLRAIDRSYGHRLKRLAAYAFQHNTRAIPAHKLLAFLGHHAAAILTREHLGVAREPGHVQVQAGRVFFHMEALGQSFARFVRALRMGLGDRHGDPLVARALDLFRGDFRHHTMPELLEIAHTLRDIFGEDALSLLESVSQDHLIGGHAPADIASATGGLSDRQLQELVERVIELHETPMGTPDSGGCAQPARVINLSADATFQHLHTIHPRTHDPAAHNALAGPNRRASNALRETFLRLGVSLDRETQRTSGMRLDRTRAQRLITHRDPRVLIARTPRPLADLFLGVLIDCSASMSSGTRMPRARSFGAMIAEATRGLRGVDARFWGFDDRAIYDAGTAERCAVHALTPSGGNNDAAALYHASRVALASRRAARLLIMISDGSPSACSVNALRTLVHDLTRRQRISCAQVAVRSIDEVCFPHYVEVLDEDIDTATRRFRDTIESLVWKTLRAA